LSKLLSSVTFCLHPLGLLWVVAHFPTFLGALVIAVL